MFHNGIYATATRALPQRLAQLGNLLRVTCCDQFHVALVSVLHPAAHADLCRATVDKPPKPNTLHPTFYEVVPNL